MPYPLTVTGLFDQECELYVSASCNTVDHIADLAISFTDPSLQKEYGVTHLRLIEGRIQPYINPSPKAEFERKLSDILQAEHDKFDLWSLERG